MPWNWQQADWPRFEHDPAALEALEDRFLHRAGVLLGAMRHIQDEDRDQLVVQILSEEAVKTAQIEGEALDRDSVQSSIRRQFGLSADALQARPAERGIAEVMTDLYRDVSGPLDEARLFRWHTQLMQGRRDLHRVGGYRAHAEPMQVVSGPLHAPIVHFEAPPSETVAAEMARFLAWFNAAGPGGSAPLPPVTRAGMAHLYFVSIHPFEDGNGRIGRAISELALSQALGRPTLLALSRTIEARKSAYYDALESANKHNAITDWLVYFGGTILDAQAETHRFIAFLIEKTRVMDRVRGRINARQEKALLRMFREGPVGFTGGLSAGNYRSITKAAPATATRDLNELVDLGVLVRTGERRYTRYHLNIELPDDIE